MHKLSTPVTPFDWQRYTAPTAERPAARQRKAEERPLSATERARRILAHRWGNPYCKPGAA